MDKLKQANLQINAEKFTFCRAELKCLGHVVSRYGIHTDPDKVAAIEQLAPPTTVNQITTVYWHAIMVSPFHTRFFRNRTTSISTYIQTSRVAVDTDRRKRISNAQRKINPSTNHARSTYKPMQAMMV